MKCNTQPCPIDCVVNPRSPFGGCSETCGGGMMTRRIEIMTRPAYGGLPCPACPGPTCPASHMSNCNEAPCPVACLGQFSEWGECTKRCGGGTQSKTYSVSIPVAHGGAACPEADGAISTQACNTEKCEHTGLKRTVW
jgi:hypothetical protein